MSGAPRSKPRFVYVDDNPANVQLFRLAPNTAKLDRDLTVSKTVSKCRPSWGSRWLWPPSCLASDYLDLSSRLAIAAACQPGSFSITSGLDRNITRITSTGCMRETLCGRAFE